MASMKYILSLLITITAAVCCPAQSGTIAPDNIDKQMQSIRPAKSALRWQQIPWVTDLEKGLATAKKENRPIFLWGSDDDPLERC